MPFNADMSEFTRLFSFLTDRAADTEIKRSDLDAQFNDLAAALEQLVGGGVASLSIFGSVPAWTPKDGTFALFVKGADSAYDGHGGLYLATTDTEQPHNPPLWLVDAAGNRWRRLSPILQSSSTDATAGRLMGVGAFGLGGNAPRIDNAATTAETIAPGLWSYSSADGSTGGPANVTKAMLLHTRRGTGLGETQLWVIEASTNDLYPAGSVLSRARTGGAWGGFVGGSSAAAVIEPATPINFGATDNGTDPGVYGYSTTAGSTGGPAGVTKGIVHWDRHPGDTGETQIMVVEASGNAAYPVGGVTSRSRQAAGAWSSWWSPTVVEDPLAPLIGNISVTNNSIESGVYAYDDAQGSTGGPAGVNIATLYHARRTSAGGETQLLVVESSTEYAAGTLLARARGTGAWTDWLPNEVDTGNGVVRKFPDGRMECYRDIPASTRSSAELRSGLYVSIDLDYPYPTGAAFVGEPDFTSASLKGFGFANGFIVAAGGDATLWKLRYGRVNDFASESCPAVRLFASGRWK